MELVSPLPGRDEPAAQLVRRFLDARGEGVFCLICEVADLSAADAKIADMELPVAQRLHFTDAQLQAELGGRFTRFDETVYDSADQLGFALTYNLMELARN